MSLNVPPGLISGRTGGLFFNHIDIVFSASLFHLLNGLVDGPNKGLFLPLTIMTTLSLTVYMIGQ